MVAIGSPSPQSCSSEKTLFGTVWKMSRIFREFFCGHFPWKLQDENLRKISPKFHRIFRRSLTKISRELRSGGMRAQVAISDLFSRRFRDGISFPNFVERCFPELPPPSSALYPFSLQNRALFEGEKRAKRCREKGRKRGGQQRGQKGKKDARKQVRFFNFSEIMSASARFPRKVVFLDNFPLWPPDPPPPWKMKFLFLLSSRRLWLIFRELYPPLRL